jgi:hypothetical protein
VNPYRIEKFDGGIADSYLAVQPPRNAWLENFYLDEVGKPYVREGTEVLSQRIPVNGASTRLSGIYLDSIPFNYPLVVRADKLYRVDATDTPNEIQGPTGNPAFPNKTHTDFESATIWQRQLIVAGAPSTFLPARVVNTSGDDTFVAYTLGLPAITTKPSVSSAGGTGNTYLWGFHWLWVFQDGASTVYEELGPPVYVQLTNIGTPNTNTVTITGLPSITNTASTNYDTGTLVVASVGTTNGSAVLTGFSSTANILVGMAVSGSGIPAGTRVLSKTATTVTLSRNCTATSSVTVTFTRLVVKIFRTASNGTTLFELATIANGTTSFSDSIADSAITDNDVIYTDGDVQPWEAPPADAKYVVEVNDVFWYGGDRYIQQSVQGAPGGCPSLFRQPTASKLMGLASTDTFPVAFFSRSVQRIEGTFDEFGDGGFEFKEISENAGCVSNRGIVKTPQGIVWPGIGSFWWTDGYQARRISMGLPQRYKIYNNPQMVGVYDAKKNTVEWTASSAENNTTAANDIRITLFLDFGISEFSTFAVQTAKNNIYPTTLGFSGDGDVPDQYRNRLLIGESRGYLLWTNPAVYTDPYIDITKFPTDFNKKVIQYRWESAALSLGDDSMRSYVIQLTAELDAATEVSAQFYTRRDVRGAWASLSEFRQDGAIVWGTSEYPWNDPTVTGQGWNEVALVDGQRSNKHPGFRGARWQVALTNSKTWIARSDLLGTATCSNAAPYVAVTLDDSAKSWPDDCEDYELTFSDDNYTEGFTVIERTSDTVVKVIDPYGTLATWPWDTKKWQMRGYRKNERIKLQSVTLWVTDKELSQRPGKGDASVTNG